MHGDCARVARPGTPRHHARVPTCRPLKMRRLTATLIVMGSLAQVFGAENMYLEPIPLRTRLSGEVIRLANGEGMAVAGLHEDIFVNRTFPGVYAGLGGYGAASGERGGFFIVGGSVGWCVPLWQRLGLDIGAFAGGGGGTRDTGQGDGLMLRGHAVSTWDLGPMALRVGIAHTDFPGGTIRSTGFTAGLTVSDSFTVIGNASEAIFQASTTPVTTQRWSIAPLAYIYHLDNPTIGREGTPLAREVDVIGIELARHFDAHWRIPLVLGGAVGGGNRAGYMDVSSGIIYGIGSRWRAEIRALVGLGGGGSFRTGNGILLRPEIALGYAPTPDWCIDVRGGRIEALAGDFTGWVTGIAVHWQPTQWHVSQPSGIPATLSSALSATLPANKVRPDSWRVRVGSTVYSVRNVDRPLIQLIDVAIEKPLTPQFIVVGRTRSAYAGDAGSYSEGLFGARFEHAWSPRWRTGIEADIGAGGGGGLETGQGFIADALVDVAWRMTDTCEVTVGVGRIAALYGDFSADLFQLGLRWNFSRALVRSP